MWVSMFYSTGREQGASFIEFIIVLPLLCTVALGLGELGTALSQYALITSIAEQAARSGARMNGLEVGAFTTSMPRTKGGALPPLMEVSTGALTSVHGLMHNRVRNLLAIAESRGQRILLTDLFVDTQYVPTGGAGGSDEDTLQVSIRGNYESLFPSLSRPLFWFVGLPNLNIESKVYNQYLY